MKALGLLLVALLLGGCAAKGPLYEEHKANLAPLPQGHGRLLVFRPDTSNYGKGAQVAVYLNEFQQLGVVEYLGFNAFVVPEGDHKLTVNGGTIGSCRIAISVTAGIDNAVELRPTRSSAISVGAFLGGAIGAQLASLAGGECAGGWEALPVSSSTAQHRLRDLRLSSADLVNSSPPERKP